jgi:hypothetical protein
LDIILSNAVSWSSVLRWYGRVADKVLGMDEVQ